ncbi:substrate-binding domain-containing protein [Pseudarthrobacter sp. S9]|uniref:substrate-binding domain-containing protein n=1 Tax=Pseudarthrobacter sp. S9 TaxID=3418421 RepID=UPI003D040437
MTHISVLPGDYTEEAGAAAAEILLADGLPCTAVLAANDRCAVGLMFALPRAGIRVPEDVSIVGVDDSRLAQMSHVGLTSVKQDVPRMAPEVMNMAIASLEGQQAAQPFEVVVETALAVRNITAVPLRTEH